MLVSYVDLAYIRSVHFRTPQCRIGFGEMLAADRSSSHNAWLDWVIVKGLVTGKSNPFHLYFGDLKNANLPQHVVI